VRFRGVLIFAVLVALSGCSPPPRDVPPLPTPPEVEKITATVFGTSSNQPDLAEFEIPAAFVSDVLRILSPVEHREHPKSADVVACLHIACRDGRVLDVELISTRGGTILFTVGGVPCRRIGTYADLDPASGVHLPEVLRIESFLRAVQQGKPSKAKAFLDRLDVSAGR
jgi:hypothetical protein